MTSPEHGALWAAPRAEGPVTAVVSVPGSKSITNRALLLAALADGPGEIRRPLRSRDTDLMLAAVRALGTDVEELAAQGDLPERWQVRPQPLRGPARIDCGLAGTVMRFVPPLAALADGEISFDGDPRARERPMGPVLGALRTLGAKIDGADALPFTLTGRGSLPGGHVQIDASASSQFVSGLLLAAPAYDAGVSVDHVGDPVPSLPHIKMTIAMLRDVGVLVEDETPQRWRVTPGPVRARDLDVEPDLSNAAPFLAAALITSGRVSLPAWPASTTQPGAKLRDLLARMGAECRVGKDGLVVIGRGRVHGIDADLRDESELAPTLVAIAAVADSPSTLRGIAHMRGHETDRLAALAAEINRLGGAVTEIRDGLRIEPRPLSAGVFRTYHDHRMATTGALLALVVPGIEVENVETTTKTMPDFVGSWLRMLGRSD